MLNALGPLIKECAEKLAVECVKRVDDTVRLAVESWLSVYGSEYSILSRQANKIMARKKWNKPRLLPLTQDILKLNSYLKTRFSQAMEQLERGFNFTFWVQLCKSTLLIVLIFNRKRVGELEKLRIEDYKKKHNIQKIQKLTII